MKTTLKIALATVAIGVAVKRMRKKRYYIHFNEDGSIEHNLPSIIKEGKSLVTLSE